MERVYDFLTRAVGFRRYAIFARRYSEWVLEEDGLRLNRLFEECGRGRTYVGELDKPAASKYIQLNFTANLYI